VSDIYTLSNEFFYKHKKTFRRKSNNICDVCKRNIVTLLRNVYTSSAILTGWYHFIWRGHFYASSISRCI